MNDSQPVICVAILAPIYGAFDYLPAPDTSVSNYSPGKRVLIPFGTRKLIGVVTGYKTKSSTPPDKLKHVIQLFDETPVISSTLLKLLQWSATYYCHPLGDCIQSALPSALRKNRNTRELVIIKWHRTEKPFQGRSNAVKQKKILSSIASCPHGIEQASLKTMGFLSSQLNTLEQSGYIQRCELDPLSALAEHLPEARKITLNDEQKAAYLELSASLKQYKASLLQGVTGSGKTEVYIKLVAQILKQGKQALVLIPEINLTPQTLARFQSQLATPISVLHSGISEREKFTTWSLAKRGRAQVVIGTRSAIFTPFKTLGIIIVDEEHDSSYKQMDGFKYSARDLAVKRAQLENCNVILGSATPSLESIHNAMQQKYQWIKLNKRAGLGLQPNMSLIDIRSRPMQNGCSQPLIENIRKEITKGNQVIIFQNRRGYSPTLMCNNCGSLIQCLHCDARMTVHSKPPCLHCHHCNFKSAIPAVCEHCQSTQLNPVGIGTERLEYGLTHIFPDTQTIRIDRDNIKNQKQMEQLIDQVNQGQACLLIGTQMLAKGHDFHNVTLVAIIDADASFFSADFRAIERSAQQLLQVSGRTGRGAKKGRVLIQTRQADHPIFESILKSDYETLARNELRDRKTYGLPPFSKMISVRADARIQTQTLEALQSLYDKIIKRIPEDAHLKISGPIPANISRKSGIYRSYLHLYTKAPKSRAQILRFLPALLQSRSYKHVKLTVDVDPLEYL